MIKTVGMMLLAATSISVGYIAAANVKGRVDELIYVRRLMAMFQGELRYKNVALADAFEAVAGKSKGVYSILFHSLSVSTEDNHSIPMSRLFADKVEEILSGQTLLNADDIQRLKELGETMGYQDQKMQLANIDLYIDRLSESIEEDRLKMRDIMKMYRTLGVMGALMCVIVFM